MILKILDEGLRGVGELSPFGPDRNTVEVLAQDIISICKSDATYHVKYDNLTKTINCALSGHSNYLVQGYGMLERLVSVVEEDSALAVPPADLEASEDDTITKISQVKQLITDFWPNSNGDINQELIRRIVIGELTELLLNVFKDGKQVGKQEADKAMKAFLEQD